MDSLLPSNATPLETALAQSIGRISGVPTPCRDVWNADACPSALLPWLAWAFSVDEWDASWTDAQKRGAIKSAVAVQRYKGTIGAVRDALGAIGFGVQVQEWFNQLPQGAPYTYSLLVSVDQDGADQLQQQKMLSVVETAKNLRSHLSSVQVAVATRATLVSAGVNGIGSNITIQYDPSIPRYSDGSAAFDLMFDAQTYGEQSTTAAMDGIDTTVSVTMPANSWKAT